MSEKIEGTIVLEGLVEGPVPPFPDAQEKLERWTQECGRMEMKLQMDGGHFSVMPTNKAMPAASLGEDASMAVADSLSELLRMFPPLERRQVFSTLRSVEWRRKLEVRTIYAVGPDGRIATQQERSPCDTVAPPQPLSPKEMLLRGGIGLLVAAAILGISALFIDYPKQWRRMTASVEPATVVVQPGAFAPFLRVEVTGLDRRNGVLLVTLSRGAAYPLSDAELDALYEHPPDMVTSTAPAATAATASRPADFVGLLRRRLAVEALGRGVVRMEFRDGAGKYLGEARLRTDDLRQAAKVEGAVPAPVVDNRLVAPAVVELLP